MVEDAAGCGASVPKKDTAMTTLTKAQLNQILSALDGQPRNPNTKDAALKAIGHHGERLGLNLDDILSAGAGLLDGRISAEAFRASLQEAEQPAEEPVEPEAEAPAEPESEAEDAPAELESEAAIAEVAPAEATNAQPKAPKLRNGTKQALMIDMLRRPEGATVEQIAEATKWARHTVRGAMAGALKKKLGLTITSEKTEGAARTYHIAD
jgi:hypothetical protein